MPRCEVQAKPFRQIRQEEQRLRETLHRRIQRSTGQRKDLFRHLEIPPANSSTTAHIRLTQILEQMHREHGQGS